MLSAHITPSAGRASWLTFHPAALRPGTRLTRNGGVEPQLDPVPRAGHEHVASLRRYPAVGGPVARWPGAVTQASCTPVVFEEVLILRAGVG
jgi:hypothetical protein